MSRSRAFPRSLMVFAFTLTLHLFATTASAQIGGFTPAGVEIDAENVMRVKLLSDPTGALRLERLNAAKASLSPEVMKTSKLRKISLNRLESVAIELAARGESPSPDMANLAGLTRVTHVFYFPETKDIVIAGPAEGYFENINGKMIGMETGSAILQLQDLVAALRAFPAEGTSASLIGCSIDPTQEGLKAMQAYVREAAASFTGTAAEGEAIANGLKQSLGMQKVSVKGVSPKTHFAQVMVEADYHMKLIGIGLEKPPVNISSYISKANPSSVQKNALQRWYFVPNYDRLRVSEDNLAMEFVGTSTKLVGETEAVTNAGERVRDKGRSDKASSQFCDSFTKNYQELSRAMSVYGELGNLMDLAIAAAYIQHRDYYSLADWKMEFFGNEEKFSIETDRGPEQVESAVNAVWKGNLLMTPIGGGVTIHAREALNSNNMKVDPQSEAKNIRESIDIKSLSPNQWWWD